MKLALDVKLRGLIANIFGRNSHVAFWPQSVFRFIDLSTAANQPFYREDLGLDLVFNWCEILLIIRN